MQRPFPAFGLAALFYLILTAALTWPLVLHPATVVPSDLGDSLLNMYLLAWNARELPLGERWWNLPQFYPMPGVMAFSEHLLGLAPITTPIILASGDALLAYNVAFFLSFPLCAIAAHVLGYELTRRHDVSLLMAVAYGFAPYRMAQLAHVQILSAYWIPLALFALHRCLRTSRWRWAALFAIAWLMQALACGYYLFYLSVLVGLWLGWFAIGRAASAVLARIALAWGVAALCYVPIALGYLRYQRAYGLQRGASEIEAFSGDIASLLTASVHLRLWGWLQAVPRPEADLFPGVTIVVLIAAGAILAWRSAAGAGTARHLLPRVLFCLSAALTLLAATPLWFGPWRIELAGVRLLSVGTARKPFSVAVLCLLVALAMHPSVRAGWRTRSPLAFYTLAAFVLWMLCLGPAPTFLNEPVLYKAPYSWLMLLPGFDSVRVPARFFVLVTLCLAVAAGLGLRQLTRRWPALRAWLPAVMIVLVLAESWTHPLPLVAVPDDRPASAAAVARLDLPFSVEQDMIALYRAIGHRRPMINGYSGYVAPHYPALRYLLARHDPAALTPFANLGPVEVVVDRALDTDGRWRAYVAGQPGVKVVRDEARYTAFLLPRTASGRGQARSAASASLPVASVAANRSPHRVREMLDGNRATRWDTGRAQMPGDEVTIDLGGMRRVEDVELQIGGFIDDFPRALIIELSEDGESWQSAWQGSAALQAVQGALQDPDDVPLSFALGGASARFIKLRQGGSDPLYYWSIAELRVHGQ